MSCSTLIIHEDGFVVKQFIYILEGYGITKFEISYMDPYILFYKMLGF